MLIKKNKGKIELKKEEIIEKPQLGQSVRNIEKLPDIIEQKIYAVDIIKPLVFLIIYLIVPSITIKIGDIVILGGTLNIFYTISIGLCGIYLFDSFRTNARIENMILIFTYVLILVNIASIVDYGITGILFILAMYGCKKRKVLQTICLFIFSFFLYRVDVYGGFLNPFVLSTIFAIPLIILYNGKIGRKFNKKFFYIFYPAHILIIVALEKIFRAFQQIFYSI